MGTFQAKIIATTILLISTAVFCVHLFSLWSFTVDDAFISMRYAHNLYTEGKLTWNIHQAPIEGYTSFLGIIWLYIGYLLHASSVVWAKTLGVLSISTIILFTLTKIFTSNKPFFVVILSLSSSFLLIDTVTAVHVVAGLETTLDFLLLFTLLLIFRSLYDSLIVANHFKKRAYLFAIIALLLGLTRPENNLYILLLSGIAFVTLKDSTRHFFIKGFLCFYFLPGLIYFIWRVHYFNLLFPLPFYIKFDTNNIIPGFHSVAHFLDYYWPLLIVLMACWIIALKSHRAVVLSYGAILLSGLAFSLHAEPIMSYALRFSWPLLSLTLATAWLIKDTSDNTQKYIMISLICALVLFMGKNHSEAQWLEHAQINYAKGLEQAHITLGKQLATVNSNLPLVTCDDGAIPFYSHWPVIDSCALNNKTLATTSFSPEEKAHFIISQNPRIIILISTSSKKLLPPSTLAFQTIVYSEALKSGMHLIQQYEFEPNYYLWVIGYPRDKAVSSVLKGPT